MIFMKQNICNNLFRVLKLCFNSFVLFSVFYFLKLGFISTYLTLKSNFFQYWYYLNFGKIANLHYVYK